MDSARFFCKGLDFVKDMGYIMVKLWLKVKGDVG